MKDKNIGNNNYNYKSTILSKKYIERERESDCDRSAVLTVEMGVLTVEEKLIQVDMLRLEVVSKGLRADVLHEREVEAFGRADIVER